MVEDGKQLVVDIEESEKEVNEQYSDWESDADKSHAAEKPHSEKEESKLDRYSLEGKIDGVNHNFENQGEMSEELVDDAYDAYEDRRYF